MSDPEGDEFWERVHATFQDALDRPAPERRAWVKETLAGVPEARREVLALLSNHIDDTSEPFLRPPAHEALAAGLQGASTVREGPPALPDLTGQTLAGRYLIGERLDAGGTGVVYRTRDQVTGQQVALKAMAPAMDGRLVRHEAAILRALRLPGVVALLDDGVSQGVAYLVTELVEGTPFPGRHVPGQHVPGWQDIERTVVALLETLERIHRAGIVHRDLKPGNVLVKQDGLPVVLDLGVSEPTRTPHPERALHRRAGTLRYMAPEQLREQTWSPRSDLHAVGVMIHEALAGGALRSALTAELARTGVMPGRPPPLAEAAPGVPAEICRIVDWMLAPDPEDRPATAREVLRALPLAAARGEVPGFERDAHTPEELRGLFHGPDRLHHLRTDATLILWQRTQGRSAAVRDELAAWDRAGLGRWEAGRFRIDRSTLDRLRAGLRVSAPRRTEESTQDPLGTEVDLLVGIELAGPRATRELLASVLNLETRALAQELRSLCKRALVRENEGRFELPALPQSVSRRLAGDVCALHSRIADSLPPDDERRILHRVAAGDFLRVPREAIEVADECYRSGGFLPPHALLEALRCVTPDTDPSVEVALLERLLVSAFRQATRTAFDELLYHLSRGGDAARIREMERVARGALRTLEGDSAGALSELPDPRTPGSPLVREAALSARMFAVRHLPLEEQPRWITEAETFADELGCDGAPFIVLSARAWLAYGEDRYSEAAQLHLLALADRGDSYAVVLSTLNAASAFLEAGELDRAEGLARKVADTALAGRDVPMEARAERVLRAAAYRRGDDLTPDLALVSATRQLNAYLGALVALTEAGIAWRCGQESDALRLATEAGHAWRAAQAADAALLADSLAFAVGAEDLDPVTLLAACDECPARIAVQAAALLARRAPHLRTQCRSTVERCAAEVPDDPAARLELISMQEALALTSPP